MPERFFSAFTSHDLLGKSIPGALATAGIISYLPIDTTAFLNTFSGNMVTFSFVVGLAIVSTIFGFIIGQGVHTLSIFIERSIYLLGYQINQLYTEAGLPDKKYYTQPNTYYDPLPAVTDGFIRTWLNNRFISSQRYLRRFRNNIKLAFSPHRVVFAEYCRQLDSTRDEQFRDHCISQFNINPDGDDVSYRDTLYPHILSYLEHHNASRSGRFKANYKFCRSIWATLLVFSIGYGIASIHTFHLFPGFYTHPSLILQFFPEDLHLVAAGLFASAVLFLSASASYKHNYAEYIVTDFTAIKTASDTQNQSPPDQSGPTQESN